MLDEDDDDLEFDEQDAESVYWVRIGHIAGATAIAKELAMQGEDCVAERGECPECLMFAKIASWILVRVMDQAGQWGMEIVQSAPSTDTLQ
jgi:hypothetical protein